MSVNARTAGSPLIQHVMSQGGQVSGTDSPSTSGTTGKRKRKTTKQQRKDAASQNVQLADHAQQQQAALAAAAARQQQSIAMQQQPGHMQAGMAIGVALHDEDKETALDDLDQLTTRDMAITRYRRGHELLSMIFDPQPVEQMRPPPSIYASYNTSALKVQLERMQKNNDAARDVHADKMRKLKETLATKVWPTEDTDGGYADVEPWARKPASGPILGVGLVRASTPEDLRDQIYPPPQPKPAEAAAGGDGDVSMQTDGPAAEVRGEDGMTDEERRKKEAEVIDEINQGSGEKIPSAILPTEEQQTASEKAAFAPVPASAPLQAPDTARAPASNDADVAAVAEAAAAAAAVAAVSGMEDAQMAAPTSEAAMAIGDQIQMAGTIDASDSIQTQPVGEFIQPAAVALEALGGMGVEAPTTVAADSEASTTAPGQPEAHSTLEGDAVPTNQEPETSVVGPEAAADVAADVAAAAATAESVAPAQAEPVAEPLPAQSQQSDTAVEPSTSVVPVDALQNAVGLPDAAVSLTEDAPPQQQQNQHAPEQGAPVLEGTSSSAEGPPQVL